MFDIDRFVARRDRYRTCEQAIADQIDLLNAGPLFPPNFMIIGAPRSGTTFLFALLSLLPDVYMPADKELKFFSANLASWDLHSYLHQFKLGAGKLCGEASPLYAVLPVRRIELVRKLNPSLRVIYLLREPRQRLASEWKHISREIAGWTEHELACYVASDAPVMACDYAGNLERWLRVFPADQVKVLFFEDLVSDPADVLGEVVRFLGLPARAIAEENFALRHNETWDDSDIQKCVDRIEPYLLGTRTARLKTLMERIFPGTRLPAWLAEPRQPGREPVIVLFELDPIRAIGATSAGEYLCGPRAALEELARAGHVDHERIRDLRVGIGRYLTEAVNHRALIENLDENRLYALSHGDRWENDLFVLRENYFGWNVVAYRGLFYTIRSSAGRIDLRESTTGELRELTNRGEIVEFDGLDEALDYASKLWSVVSLVDPDVPRRKDLASRPNLAVEGFLQYNIIRLFDRFYGIHQSEGPFDLERFSANAYTSLISGDTLEEVKQKARPQWVRRLPGRALRWCRRRGVTAKQHVKRLFHGQDGP